MSTTYYDIYAFRIWKPMNWRKGWHREKHESFTDLDKAIAEVNRRQPLTGYAYRIKDSVTGNIVHSVE